MKIKYLIAFTLLLVGTNLFTFATTRYETTNYVLTRAQDRMDKALITDGLYDKVYAYPSGPVRPEFVDMLLAIRNAGGLYFGANERIPYWIGSFFCIIFGILLPFHEPRRKKTD